jgi:prevent-host-death family protein
MIKTIQATALRNNFKDALDHVKSSKKPLIITERGVATTVLVDIDEFEDYLMSVDKEFMEGLRESVAQMKRGEVYSFEDVFSDVL